MKRASAPGYDLFKLVVTLFLIALLIWLALSSQRRGPKHTPPPIAPTAASPTEIIPAAPTASATAVPATLEPTATPTVDSATPTPTATPTETPAAPTAAPIPDTAACGTSVASRLQVGAQAKVLSNLNMRVEPSISADILKTNITGTLVEVIDGPVCTPQGNGAYLWWRIRLSDGREGWSAETALIQKTYFLEPVP